MRGPSTQMSAAMTSARPSSRWSRHRARVGTLLVIAALGVALGSGQYGDRSTASGTEDTAAAEMADEPAEETAAATGLAITPATGSTEAQPISVTIPTACVFPEGTAPRVLVTVTGGGFVAGSNMLGLTDLDDPVATSFNAGGTWSTIASNNPGTASPLSGTANLALVCVGANPATSYTGQVLFTPTTGGNSSFQLTGGGAASPSPSPSTSPSPTPSTSASPSPSPSASESPSPSSSPGASASPCPTEDEATEDCEEAKTDDETTDDDVTTDGELPDTGAHNPSQMLLTAAMLGFLGLALLMFEAASRPREDW